MAWTNARGIQIRVKHIPGNLNVVADSLSRRDKVIQTEWALNHQVFNQICHCWHQPMVDLFAAKLNRKLPMCVTPVPDSQAWETYISLGRVWTAMCFVQWLSFHS